MPVPVPVPGPVLRVCVALRRRLRFFRRELSTKIIPRPSPSARLLCCIVACVLSPTPIHHPNPDSLPPLLSHIYPHQSPPSPRPPPPYPYPTSIPIPTSIPHPDPHPSPRPPPRIPTPIPTYQPISKVPDLFSFMHSFI